MYSSFEDKTWCANIAGMQLISKCNKRFRFLLLVIDICSKYTWNAPLKNKKGITITNALQKVFNEFERKLEKCG